MWRPVNEHVYEPESLAELEKANHLRVHLEQKVENCLTVRVNLNLDSASGDDTIQVVLKDGYELEVKLYKKALNTRKLFDLTKALHESSMFIGYGPLGHKFYTSSDLTHHKFQNAKITLFAGEGEQIDDKFAAMVEKNLKTLLVEKMTVFEENFVRLRETIVSKKNRVIVVPQDDPKILEIDPHLLVGYLDLSQEVNQFTQDDPAKRLTKYKPLSQLLNLCIFVQPKNQQLPKFKIGQLYGGVSQMSQENKHMYAVSISQDDSAEKYVQKFLSEAIRKSYKIPSISEMQQEYLGKLDFKDSRTVRPSDIKVYLHNQQILDTFEIIENFKLIIRLLDMNPLEKLYKIYQGKDIHQLASEIEEGIYQHSLKSDINENRKQLFKKDGVMNFIDQESKEKIGVLYETKKMNPPWFFSFEFRVGTYMPILSPFFLSLLQMLFAMAKSKYKEWREDKDQKKVEDKQKKEN